MKTATKALDTIIKEATERPQSEQPNRRQKVRALLWPYHRNRSVKEEQPT